MDSDMDQLVLDDEMMILFENFRSGNILSDRDRNKIITLIGKLKLPYKTNADQIIRCCNKLPKNFIDDRGSAILANGTTGESLADMARHTLYKIILTDGKDNLPFINISSKTFCTDFNIYLKKGESRNNLHEYIKRCTFGATKIHIFDRYLGDAIDRGNCNIENLILDNSIEIICYEHISTAHQYPISTKLRNHISKYCKNKISSKQHNFNNIHDRYMTIEYPTYKYQIILSSGFEYLFCDKKEITCVFRKV